MQQLCWDVVEGQPSISNGEPGPQANLRVDYSEKCLHMNMNPLDSLKGSLMSQADRSEAFQVLSGQLL